MIVALLAAALITLAPSASTTVVARSGPAPLADRYEPSIPHPDRLLADPLCPAVEPAALEAGWPADPVLIATLDLIVFRESTCDPTATGGRDPGSIGSIGWAQINSAAWCDPTRWYPDGYMQHVGVITSCQDLYDPVTNLRAALVIYLRQGSFRAWSTAP